MNSIMLYLESFITEKNRCHFLNINFNNDITKQYIHLGLVQHDYVVSQKRRVLQIRVIRVLKFLQNLGFRSESISMFIVTLFF